MINTSLEGSMKVDFSIEDIVKKYGEISKIRGSELDRTIYKISHDLNGSYGRLTGILGVIDLSSHETSDKEIIEEIKTYSRNSKNAVTQLTKIIQSKNDPLTLEEIYSENTTTSKNEELIKEYASIIFDSAKHTSDKKPLLMSVIKDKYRDNVDNELKELLSMGDVMIDKIVNTHNNFFSKHQDSHYAKRNLAGEYLTSESITAYVNSSESKLIGKIEIDLTAELNSNEDIFSEYILPIIDNIKDHAWEKNDSEYNNDIYNREDILEKKCLIKTRADNQNRVFKISIADNGYGIHPKLQEKIFSQGATGRKDKEEHGIGLNLLRNKIRSIGGNISFISEQGLGTKFTIELPYRKKIEEEDNSYIQ